MKKLLGIVVLGFLLSNIAYSKENLTLVCSFEKSVIEIPNASSGDGEIVKNKDELSPSVTMDKYIVLNILSKDEAIVVDTSFHHDLNGKFEFIISSIAKNCGHYNLKENYKCTFYKPLISSTLIN